MPSLAQIEKQWKKEGKPIGDFLSQEEVNALLKGVTGETDEPEDSGISEDDWPAAMAADATEDEKAYLNQIVIVFSPSQVGRLMSLLEEQTIVDFYDIYHLLKVNVLR